MNILLVEDDSNKSSVLIAFLTEHYPGARITIASSFHSAKKELLTGRYDLTLLDMQLPQFDKSQHEEGGRRQSLAGLELIRQMKRRAIGTPAVVVTQFREFGEETDPLSFADLTSQLKAIDAPAYKGIVYYNAKIANWRTELRELLRLALLGRFES